MEKIGKPQIKKMDKKAKCPHCKALLVSEDCYDFTAKRLEDGRIAVIHNIMGYCPECKKEFDWEEVYPYEGVRKVVEV